MTTEETFAKLEEELNEAIAKRDYFKAEGKAESASYEQGVIYGLIYAMSWLKASSLPLPATLQTYSIKWKLYAPKVKQEARLVAKSEQDALNRFAASAARLGIAADSCIVSTTLIDEAQQ
jgi:hypothetical protein